MATRTDDLTEFSKLLADELKAKYGNLKRVLSAGVLALNDMSAEEREYYMAKAIGVEVERPQRAEEQFRKKVLDIVKESQKIPAQKKSSRQIKSAKSAG